MFAAGSSGTWSDVFYEAPVPTAGNLSESPTRRRVLSFAASFTTVSPAQSSDPFARVSGSRQVPLSESLPCSFQPNQQGSIPCSLGLDFGFWRYMQNPCSVFRCRQLCKRSEPEQIPHLRFRLLEAEMYRRRCCMRSIHPFRTQRSAKSFTPCFT